MDVDIIVLILISSLCYVVLQVLKQQNKEPLVIGSQDQAEETSDTLQLEQEVEHFKRVKFHSHNFLLSNV